MSAAREQAAHWFTRLLHLPDEHPERERFRAWHDADPAHAREYQAFCELWGEFSSTSGTQTLATAMRQRQGRRTFMRKGALGLFALLAAGLGWRYWQRDLFEQSWVTVTGECRRQRLPDGSELYLAAQTRLQVRFDALQRQVYLLQGQVIFDVAHDLQRPFRIDGGLARITVLGTRFVVERDAQELRVSVQRGSVRVDSDHDTLVLQAGQVARIRAGGDLGLLPVAASNAFAFEQGRLVLEQASLEEIAASLSRYRQQPVRVQAGKRRPLVNAVVQLDNIEGFLQALPAIVPVQVSSTQGVTWLRGL